MRGANIPCCSDRRFQGNGKCLAPTRMVDRIARGVAQGSCCRERDLHLESARFEVARRRPRSHLFRETLDERET